ncbi:MAG TPA: hypothetical protein VFD70_05895 [Anaerolineae bacterium]|nr:hypothetical protein [Anaerolineae bacterium]
MHVETGVRAGVTAQDLVEGVQDVADTATQVVGGVAQGLGDIAQDAAINLQQWWVANDVGDTLNRAFWFPLEPPA